MFKKRMILIVFIMFSCQNNETTEPNATDILKQVVQVYNDMDNGYFEGDVHMELLLTGGSPKSEGKTVNIDFEITAAIGQDGRSHGKIIDKNRILSVISDGTKTWQVTEKPGEKAYSLNTLDSAHIRSGLFYGSLLDDLVEAHIMGKERLSIDGGPVDCIILKLTYRPVVAEGYQYHIEPTYRTLWVDWQRYVVLKEESDARLITNGISVLPVVGPNVLKNHTVNFRHIQIDKPLSIDTFKFTPSEGVVEVESLQKQKIDLTGQNVSAFSLIDLKGVETNLDDFNGKVILIDFWATWCGPCKTQLPLIEELHQKYGKKDLVVLGIDNEKPEKIRSFMTEQGYSFTTLLDTGGKVASAFQVEGIPTTLIVDREGVIAFHKVGYGENSANRIRAVLRNLGIN